MRACTLTAAFLIPFIAFAGEVREFSIPTLEQLGNELHRRDKIAARSSDLVRQTQPVARSLKMRGWIADLHKDGDLVYWIVDTPSGPSLAYIVRFRPSSKPEVEDVRGQLLPSNIGVRYKARQTAMQAVKGRLFDTPYNFEVLNDSDGSGFLVYALGSTKTSTQFVLAGHLRVSVSADNGTVERIDPLSKGLLIEDEKNPGLPTDTRLTGMYFNQVVSNTPVETLIYTSNLANKPIFVQTPDGKMWQVANGKMSIDRSRPGDNNNGCRSAESF